MTFSVIALSKLYDLKDPRIAQIQVKGDLITQSDGRIMTRSRARQSTHHSSILNPYNPIRPDLNISNADPDQYTIIWAPLKILKVLIVELQSAAGAIRDADAVAAAELAEEGSDEDWEDEANPFLDLGSGLSKSQLMAYAADDGPDSGRQRDDETQGFLVDFFKRAAASVGFKEEWDALTEEERVRLQESAQY